MILRRFFTFLVLGLCFVFLSATLPTKIKKKVRKEITKTFTVKDFQLKPILIHDSINQKLFQKIGADHLFKIEKDDIIVGYAFVDKAPSKTDDFDYLVLLDKNLIIAKTKVLIYREDYGGEIGSKRWLQQFIGKKASEKLIYEKDIIPISGATISAYSMTTAVNTFLQNLEILHSNNIL